MSCYHPQNLYFRGSRPDGKLITKVLPQGFYLTENGESTTLFEFADKDFIEVPCGHCLGCRQDQSKEWAARLVMEMQYHDSAYFLTLTYNDDNVPIAVDEFGVVNGLLTLNKKHVQQFMKDLRKKFNTDRIRFYAAGEYGETTARPHYHLILFGIHLPDASLVPCGRSETGQRYYTCPLIENIWKKGFVSIEPANYFTCKYVASYVTKKIGIKSNEFYEKNNMVPPFSLSSRKPGIGYQFYLDHPDMFEYNSICVALRDGSLKCGFPRYFKKKFQEENPDAFAEMSRKRRAAAEDRKEMIIDKVNMSYQEYLEVLEKSHEARIKRRDKV